MVVVVVVVVVVVTVEVAEALKRQEAERIWKPSELWFGKLDLISTKRDCLK